MLALVAVAGIQLMPVAEQGIFAVQIGLEGPLAGVAVAAAAKAVGHHAVDIHIAALGDVGVFDDGV